MSASYKVDFEQSLINKDDQLENDIAETKRDYIKDINAGYKVGDMTFEEIFECQFGDDFVKALKECQRCRFHDPLKVGDAFTAMMKEVDRLIDGSCEEAASSYHRGL